MSWEQYKAWAWMDFQVKLPVIVLALLVAAGLMLWEKLSRGRDQ